MTGLEPPGVANHLELVDLNGNVLYTQPLMVSPSNPFLYSAGPLISPKVFYHIKIVGVDEKNYQFQRLSSTAISNQTESKIFSYFSNFFKGGPRVFKFLF